MRRVTGDGVLGGSGFGQGTACPFQQGFTLGKLQLAHSERIRHNGQLCPVSKAAHDTRGVGVQWGVTLGHPSDPAGHSALCQHHSASRWAAGLAVPELSGGKAGTGGAFLGHASSCWALFSLPLHVSQSSVRLGSVPPGPSPSRSGGASSGPGAARSRPRAVPAVWHIGRVWAVVGIRLSLRVLHPCPPVCQGWQLVCRCAGCHGCSAAGALPSAAIASLQRHLCSGGEAPVGTVCIAGTCVSSEQAGEGKVWQGAGVSRRLSAELWPELAGATMALSNLSLWIRDAWAGGNWGCCMERGRLGCLWRAVGGLQGCSCARRVGSSAPWEQAWPYSSPHGILRLPTHLHAVRS